MSSREQFEAWAEKNGHDIYRSGIDDAYYFQSTQWSWDIWQAATNAMEAKCSALAAENAGLKECTVNHAHAVEHWNSWADAEDKISPTPETPAIDAFLAEVRAQGVEMFAGEIGDYAKGKSQATAEIIKATGRNALMFAAQLRKGASA